jgi:uncharacterized protein YjbJ (UPF0337 family)
MEIEPKEHPMVDDLKDKASGRLDEARGKAKETAGNATGDERTKREGQLDQAQGEAKNAAETAKDKAGDALDKLKQQ